MDVKKGDNKLKPPSSLSATIGEKDGEIDLHWDPVKNANSYAVEMREKDKKQNWKLIDIASSSRYTLTSLRHNVTYCFRVSALNNSHQGPWSNVVIKKSIKNK
jgi:hypothetical protein